MGFLCATSVSLWCGFIRNHQPQRHRGHRGCTEKSALETFGYSKTAISLSSSCCDKPASGKSAVEKR